MVTEREGPVDDVVQEGAQGPRAQRALHTVQEVLPHLIHTGPQRYT